MITLMTLTRIPLNLFIPHLKNFVFHVHMLDFKATEEMSWFFFLKEGSDKMELKMFVSGATFQIL